MNKEYPHVLTHARRHGPFQACAPSQKQQATSHVHHARGPQAKQSRRRRGRLMIVVWVLLLSVGILCLLLLLFARDAFVTDLSVFLVSLLHLAAGLLCLLGLLMLCVFFLFCRQFGRAYGNLSNANARYAQRIRRRREDLAWGPPRYPWVGHGTYDPW